MRVSQKIRGISKEWNTRGKYIMRDFDRPAKSGKVNLNYFRLKGDKQNVGDVIAEPIFQWMLDRYGLLDESIDGKTKHLYTVGSILFGGFSDATIWGSGSLFESYKFYYKMIYRKMNLDIRAVRGPESERILNDLYHENKKYVYGDPGILLPMIYRPNIMKKYEFVEVCHYTNNLSEKTKTDGKIVSTLVDDWHTFIDELLQANLIISKSLHGIILAEAYGIPAIMVRDTRAEFNMLKYRDYYYSTGRRKFPVADSFEQALTMKPCELPNLEEMREKLIEVFPKDLFKKR